jgi:hypothetical protein
LIEYTFCVILHSIKNSNHNDGVMPMGNSNAFTVTVRMPGQLPCDGLPLSAIAADAATAIMNMIDLFGPCLVYVRPLKAAQ